MYIHIANRAANDLLGAMATARSGHASEVFRHAHAEPWAWHPWFHKCWSKVAALAICLAFCSGCAPAVRVVEGTVTLDGKALPSGAIDFEPADSRGKVFGADIKQGSYRIEIPPAEAQGTSVVRILSPQPTGRKVPAGPPATPGAMTDEIAEAVPAQYNAASTLKVDLSSASPHNFELFSHPKSGGSARSVRN